jgi:hypothetical protein
LHAIILVVLRRVQRTLCYMKRETQTFSELLSKKLNNSGSSNVFIPFQKWIGWKTPTQPLMVQSFLGAEWSEESKLRLSIVRAYADDESETAWREFFPFDYASDINRLSELVVEIKNHPDFFDSDFPLDVTEYDTLIENFPELVATDALIRCHA